MNSYNKLKRDCQFLHQFSNEDIKKFISLGNVKSGDNVLDAMCGTGAIAKELSKISGINLFLLDNSELQLNEAKNNLNSSDAKFVQASVLKMPFENNFFDKVFIRNGAHELPKKDQTKLYKEVFRVLKNQGQFFNWTVELNKDNQDFFQKIIREKDKIAGFDDFVKNRYFMTKDELVNDLKKARFSKINFFDLNIFFIFSTKKWFETDLEKDKNKLKSLNDFIKNEFSNKNYKDIELTISGEDCKIKVPAWISIANK